MLHAFHRDDQPVMKKIRVLAIVGFVCGMAISVVSPSHAGTTTQFWPVPHSVGVALSPDGETLWVTSSAPTNTLSRFNARTGVIQTVIDLVPASFPREVEISPDGLTAYVIAQSATPSHSLLVVSTETNLVTQTINLGFMPAGFAVSQDGAVIFLTDYLGERVVAIDPTGAEIGAVSVGSRPLAVAYSAVDSRLYVSNQGSNTVSVLNVNDPINMLSVGVAIPVAEQPAVLAVSPDGREVWVPSQRSSTVSIIDTATLAVINTVSAPDFSDGVAFTSAGTRAFVVVRSSDPNWYGTLIEFDVPTRTQLSTTELGFYPQSIAVSPSGQTVYVSVDAGVRVVTFAPQEMTGVNAPSAALQQFELAAGATCDRVSEGFVDFPGISESLRNVGWSQSWSQWASGGQGGFVCSRQPFYTSTGNWAVR